MEQIGILVVVISLVGIQNSYGHQLLPATSVVEAFHGGKLHGLMLCHIHCRQVTGGKRGKNTCKSHPAGYLDRRHGHLDIALAQQEPAAHAYYKYSGECPCAGYGVSKLGNGRIGQYQCPEVVHDVTHLCRVEFHSRGLLHPCVGDKNPQRRQGGAYGSEPCSGEVKPGAYLFPAEEHHCDESRLHEECHNTLYCKRGTEYVAYKPAVVGPIRTKLKFKDNTGGNTHGKVDAEKEHPEFRHCQPLGRTRFHIYALHDSDYQRKSYRERNK